MVPDLKVQYIDISCSSLIPSSLLMRNIVQLEHNGLYFCWDLFHESLQVSPKVTVFSPSRETHLKHVLLHFQIPKPGPPVTNSSSGGSSSPLLPSFPRDIKIVDGKLFYEKRWFRRGQAVQVEAKSGEKFPAMISAIGKICHCKV